MENVSGKTWDFNKFSMKLDLNESNTFGSQSLDGDGKASTRWTDWSRWKTRPSYPIPDGLTWKGSEQGWNRDSERMGGGGEISTESKVQLWLALAHLLCCSSKHKSHAGRQMKGSWFMRWNETFCSDAGHRPHFKTRLEAINRESTLSADAVQSPADFVWTTYIFLLC